MARRRKKEPSGEEMIASLVFLGFAILWVSGVTPKQIMSILFWVVAIAIVAGVCVLIYRDINSDKRAVVPKGKTKNYQQRSQAKSDKAQRSLSEPSTPSEWTEDLISKLEWRVFEKLCIRLWQEKGFSVKETSSGADGGVDFYIYAQATQQKIGAVQCKSWAKRQIDVKVLRELQGVVASEALKLGLLMYSGNLSKAAIEFVANPAVSVKVQGNEKILLEIQKLSTDTQTKLLNELISGDYKTPSCPKCDIKLVERTAKKTGNVFWGCKNFPRCRYTL